MCCAINEVSPKKGPIIRNSNQGGGVDYDVLRTTSRWMGGREKKKGDFESRTGRRPEKWGEEKGKRFRER